MADIQELSLILGISAAWDLQSHAIEYQDFQSEKDIPLTCLSHVFAENGTARILGDLTPSRKTN